MAPEFAGQRAAPASGQHRAQARDVALVRSTGGLDVLRRVHSGPAQQVASVASELGKKRALGTAIALPERVQGVDVAEQLGEPFNEVFEPAASERVVVEAPEHLVGEGLDVLGQAEQVSLADRDGAELAAPSRRRRRR